MTMTEIMKHDRTVFDIYTVADTVPLRTEVYFFALVNATETKLISSFGVKQH